MANKIRQSFEFDFSGNISGLQDSIGKIQTTIENLQKSTGKVQLPTSTANTFNKDLDTLLIKLKELQTKNKDRKINIGDANEINKISKKISEIFAGLQTEMKNLGNLSEKLLPPEVLKKFTNLEKSLESSKNRMGDIAKVEGKLNDAKSTRSTKAYKLDKESRKTKISEEDYANLKSFESAQKKNKEIEERVKVNGQVDRRKYTKSDKEAIAEYERLKKVIEDAGYSSEKLGQTLKSVTTDSKISKLQNDFDVANNHVEELEKNLQDLKSASGTLSFDNLKKQASDLGVNIDGVTNIDELQNRINALKTDKINEAKQEFDGLNGEIQKGTQKAEKLNEKVTQEMNGVVDSTKRANDEFNQFTSQVQYFFGISNAIQLFKRALREALQTVKELDAAMVKIAVVSDYNMGDMWSTLPEFTKRANELGVAITEVYDATGLYVQQGLDLIESQGLANETLKMAKIAGMDAAAATDAMTSALRGFNLELNKGSAERVNDIYSKLAAITASDTQEIATAMSKTASIANNAGASIENTSAFLSMIIETTRESAETAGTALKTVIARFSELKKDPAQIGDVDGEIVDANQIESALRLAGVDLRDAAGQFRNFDEVIIELSGKWDSLDKNTQRYIATMAAGSRQQSRFLALMSDSERLAQLTDAAYNSAGASTKQFSKTLDSLESKMNQLKNAWNTFTQNLANNELIKLGIELLTDIITAINGITNAFSDFGSFIGTTLSTALVVVFFVLGKKIATNLIESAAMGLQGFGERIKAKLESENPKIKSAGQSAGTLWSQAFWAKSFQILGVATMALGMAASMMAQKLREAGDEEGAKNWEKWAGLLNIIGMGFMALSPIIKMFSKDFRNEMSKNMKSLMKFAGIALIIIGLIGIIKEIGENIANNTAEGKLKALSEATERAAEEAQKAQEAYSEWLSDKKEYNGLIETLEELTEGTAAWSEQMDKVQDKIYEMINTYPELAQYLKEDGTFTEEGIQAYDKKLKNEKELKMGMKMTAQIAEDTQKYENERNNLIEEREKELSKYSEVSAKYSEKEAYYKAKQNELNNTYKATTAGTMNYMAQGAGIEGYMSDNISVAMSKHGYDEKIAKKLQQRKAELKGGQDALATTSNISGNAALGLGGLALFAAANAWNIIGWIAGVTAAVGAVAWGVTEWLEGNNLGELQEAYSEAFGIPVDEISKDIKDDADALANAVAEKNIYEEFQKELKNAEAQLFSLGANAQKLLANDLSLLDQDFSEFGGFEKWVESLKDGVDELADDAIDDAFKEFEEKTKETVDSIDRIFGGKVQFKYEISANGEIIENKIDGLTLSGFEGGQLAAAANSLQEVFSDNTINALNSVMQSYADNQVSVNELTRAYVELGNAATITQKAVAAKKMFETGTQNIKTLAGTFMVAEANALSATNQIKEFYMNLSADQMNEIFKNGMTTAQSIMKMGASFTDLNGIVDTTGINFATLSDVLNDVKSGILSVDDLTQGFVETLDKLNKAEHIVEDTMARIATFQEPTSGRTIGKKFGEISKKLSDFILEGRYGDPALEAYFDFMFGEDAWNKALKEAEYDAEVAMSKYSEIIQTLAEDVKFFDVWKNTASDSGGLWSVDGNTINFDFSNVSSYEDLVTRIEEVTGWSQQFIESALADAQIWSKDLKGTIQQLTQVDALNTYLNNLEVVNGKITLNKEQLGKIFNDLSSEVKKKFEYSYDAFEADVARKLTEAGYSAQTSANQILSTEQKISDVIDNFKKNKAPNTIYRNYSFSTEGGTLVDTYDAEFFKEYYNDNGKTVLDAYHSSGLNAVTSYEDLFTSSNKTTQEWLKNYISEFSLRENLEWRWGTYAYQNNLSAVEEASLLEAFIAQNRKNYKQEVIKNDDGTFTVNSEHQKDYSVETNWWNSEKAISDYKDSMNEAFQLYKESGMATWEAAEKIQKQFGTSTAIAENFGQDEEHFKNSKISKTIEEWFDSSNEEFGTWMELGVTEEEAQLIRQADLINQGTIKAMDYLINSGVFDKAPKADYQKYDTDIDAVKYLNKYGVQKTNTQKAGSGSNANKQWYTGEQLGITGDGKAKSYNLTEDEARKKARKALEQTDFDWMHNFNKLGEKITRTLDNLSAEYDLAVKTLSKSTAELSKNLAEQYANMEAEAIVSQARADAAQQRMQGMLAKNSELTNYTWYEDGMVEINYDAINAAKADESLTKKIKILLDELVANAKVINENEALQLEVDTKQADFLEKITNTIINFENQVRDMVIEQYEEEIDKLEKIDSAINDANSKLINSIQKSLNRFRQDRKNEKTESNIEDKQRRLALLRADTSGANRTEIMTLEKEIGEAQEDYTDTLIDQKIDALQQQNEEASAQRQEQINIANDQLESSKENGAINEEVKRLLSSEGFEGSALEQLWRGRMETKGLTSEAWNQELSKIKQQFVEYKSAQDFKNMYTEDGINADLAGKLGTKISEIESSITTAMEGYDIMSSKEIQEAINAAVGKIKGYINENKGSDDDDAGDSYTPTLEDFWISSGLAQHAYMEQKYGNDPNDEPYYTDFIMNAGSYFTGDEITSFLKKKGWKKYATGGLNTFTGPAWLDGTPSKPELVLNATDTQNFLQLKDILSDIMRGGSFTTPQKDGDLNLEIYLNIEQGISNDYDVEQLVNKVKQEIAKVGRERNIQILTKR